MYEISVRSHFSAAHHLRDYPGDCEKHHGHNWMVEVAVRCSATDSLGMAVDFRVVKKALREVLSDLDHADLNELPYFGDRNPSSENIAVHIFQRLRTYFDADHCRLYSVKVGETIETAVTYREG